MEGVKVVRCNCISSYQDEVYGKHQRVANSASGKGSKPNRYRCTVCGKDHDTK